ncbi:unnamed protein product [Acanthosepion pharaonis]|uniref:Uncharacterized protein n=1 Tax=Acanthosepion pharaonis TaxID=158019 RepID=A0A812D686_ACAPH|nr:unnamed protein product [Sepia pharaonis]
MRLRALLLLYLIFLDLPLLFVCNSPLSTPAPPFPIALLFILYLSSSHFLFFRHLLLHLFLFLIHLLSLRLLAPPILCTAPQFSAKSLPFIHSFSSSSFLSLPKKATTFFISSLPSPSTTYFVAVFSMFPPFPSHHTTPLFFLYCHFLVLLHLISVRPPPSSSTFHLTLILYFVFFFTSPYVFFFFYILLPSFFYFILRHFLFVISSYYTSSSSFLTSNMLHAFLISFSILTSPPTSSSPLPTSSPLPKSSPLSFYLSSSSFVVSLCAPPLSSNPLPKSILFHRLRHFSLRTLLHSSPPFFHRSSYLPSTIHLLLLRLRRLSLLLF